jgi:hypothetical protein
MQPNVPRAIVIDQVSGVSAMSGVINAMAKQAAMMAWILSLGTYEIAMPPRHWPRRMPPPTTELWRPIWMESVV